MGQAFSQCRIVFPQSDNFKCWREAYQAFEKPLPRGHGSVESVRYRAVTARERSLNHRLSQQRLELVYGCLAGFFTPSSAWKTSEIGKTLREKSECFASSYVINFAIQVKVGRSATNRLAGMQSHLPSPAFPEPSLTRLASRKCWMPLLRQCSFVKWKRLLPQILRAV